MERTCNEVYHLNNKTWTKYIKSVTLLAQTVWYCQIS